MKKLVLLGILMVGVLLIACAPKIVPVEKPASEQVTRKTDITMKESWQADWESTLGKAQKEGKVVVYASSVAPPLKESFSLVKQKYGINLEIVTGRGGELSTKLLQERNSGLFLADVFIGGLNTIYGPVKKSGAIAPFESQLILPEVVNPKLWYGGKLPWVDEDRLIFTYFYYVSQDLMINTQLVKPGEIQSLLVFLEPRMKGKLLIGDPTITGTPFNGFSTMIFQKTLGLDFFRQLVKQEPVILRDDRLLVDWVARGKYSASLWARPMHVADYMAAGAPIMDIASKEGGYLSVDGSGTVLMSKAPHPNASKIFLNWLLSKEGQTIMQDSLGNQSAREDLSIEKLGASVIRKPGEKYILGANNIEKWVLEEQEKYLDLASQIFKPLLGN